MKRTSNFRFSMYGLLVVTTSAACFIGAYSWVGRQVGLSADEIATSLVYRHVWEAPVLLVWIVGIVLLQNSQLPPIVSRRATIGLGGLLTLSFLNAIFNVWWWRYTGGAATAISFAVWIVNSLLAVVFWVFLIRSLLAKTRSSGPQKDHSGVSH